MNKSKIIFLNGTSSSGKTSIAKELENVLHEPYTYLAIDHLAGFLESYLPEGYTPNKQMHDTKMVEALHFVRASMISLFHHFIKSLAILEKNIIVDHVILEKDWLQECVELLSNLSVTFVGVHCPLEELEHREKNRRDRMVGLAKSQFELVHKHFIYDIELDTSLLNSRDCALEIKNTLNKSTTFTALNQLNDLLRT
ncbi:chloramphenicol phosphotransferase CPT family protein [Bacillus alkalicellulosilyticus]|uniref:chloramphenicol phosphotransferase CPT family protein n=1 Tax=Alkalihalobacterium alkalicellulosilyticum TaxID=1912214 RepID=UPI000996E36C|nr:AAA family ATPase [Bacillus alkalicellulosilyticus]